MRTRNLIRMLIKQNKFTVAPSKIVMDADHVATTIAISRDVTATIIVNSKCAVDKIKSKGRL